MGDDQMMLGVARDLTVVAHDARSASARCHRAGIGIGERDLLIGRGRHRRFEPFEALHLLLEPGQLLLEPRGLRGERLRWRLPVGSVELAQIARDALFKLCSAPFHLRARKVPITAVHRLELAAIYGNARIRKQTQFAAEFNEPHAYLADGMAIVL